MRPDDPLRIPTPLPALIPCPYTVGVLHPKDLPPKKNLEKKISDIRYGLPKIARKKIW